MVHENNVKLNKQKRQIDEITKMIEEIKSHMSIECTKDSDYI
jgi:hypothetical protein